MVHDGHMTTTNSPEPTYSVETLETTWNTRLQFPYDTDAEFAARLTALQVPNAEDQVRQARLYAFETNKIKNLMDL